MTPTPQDEQSSPSSSPSSPGMFPARARLWDRITLGLKWAVFFALAGFFVSVTYETSTVSNGVQTECTYADVGQLALGLAALFAAVIGCRQEFAKQHERLKLGRTPTLAAAAGIVLVVIFHLFAGFGLLGGPCN